LQAKVQDQWVPQVEQNQAVSQVLRLPQVEHLKVVIMEALIRVNLEIIDIANG
jgi:hypothetical protein